MPAPVYFRLKNDVDPLSNDILVYNMERGSRVTQSGIILNDDNGKEHGIRPRWCQVYKVGKNIDWVKPGEWLLVDHGRWTYAVPYDREYEDGTVETIHLQKIDPEAILVVSDEPPLAN